MILETPAEMALNVAIRFKKLRKTKKITITELSLRSGVPYSTVRRFESTGEISFLSFVKIVSTIGEDREINELFTNITPQSIEEVLLENRR